MREVRVVRLHGIAIPERQLAVRVRHGEPVEFGERHRLDHREPLLRPIAQVAFRVLARGAMEQLPGGITQPEERPPVPGDEEASVVGDAK